MCRDICYGLTDHHHLQHPFGSFLTGTLSQPPSPLMCFLSSETVKSELPSSGRIAHNTHADVQEALDICVTVTSLEMDTMGVKAELISTWGGRFFGSE